MRYSCLYTYRVYGVKGLTVAERDKWFSRRRRMQTHELYTDAKLQLALGWKEMA